MIILVTGTPGTGKTSVSRWISRDLKCLHIDVSKLVEEKKWGDPDPTGRQTLVLADPIALIRYIREVHRQRGCIILDTLYPSVFNSLANEVYAVFVLRTHPKVLAERLLKRGWGKSKIYENMEAELIGTIESESRKFFDCVVSIDTNSRTVEETASLIVKMLSDIDHGLCSSNNLSIDWLNNESAIETVLRIERDQS
jgi:adenylate kinase